MPFELVNVDSTYLRMVNKPFKNMRGKTMKVYVDDMLVKTIKTEMRVSCMCMHSAPLNHSKCSFMVKFDFFGGFMVSEREIKVNP